MRVPKSPFADRLSADQARGLRAVRPELVAEVDFRAWTADGVLRHASFQGLRDDKAASEIVREDARAEAGRKSAAPRSSKFKSAEPGAGEPRSRSRSPCRTIGRSPTPTASTGRTTA